MRTLFKREKTIQRQTSGYHKENSLSVTIVPIQWRMRERCNGRSEYFVANREIDANAER